MNNTQPSWSGGIEVVCSGSDYARGFSQGSKLKRKIHVGIEHCLQQPDFRREQPWWMPYSLFRCISRWKAYRVLHGPISRDYPAMAERIRGIADGAGIGLKTAYLVNAFEPLLSFISDVEVPSLSACSALAVAPERSVRGEVILARNFDYQHAVEPYITLRESRPAKGYKSLDMTLAPLAGSVDGMNEKGLVIVNNYAYTQDQSVPSGTMTMLISDTLQHCATVAEALAHMARRPRWGGGLLMLVDAGGDMASLEISTTGFHVRRPEVGQTVLFHTNCYLSDEMRKLQVDEQAVFAAADHPLYGRRVLQSAERRYARFQQLLAGFDKIGTQELAQIFGDHGPQGADGEDTLCVHGTSSSTIASTQYFPKSRMLRMSTGSGCEAKHHLIGF
jgi:predicted choloylglycine hydrolase